MLAVCERRDGFLDGVVHIAAQQRLVGRLFQRVEECLLGCRVCEVLRAVV